MDKMTPWSKANPTRVGWYNASLSRNPNTRMYWNGCYWSWAVSIGDSNSEADFRKSNKQYGQLSVEWRGLTRPRMKWD